MKPTQNNIQGDNNQPVVHRMPRRYAPDINKFGSNDAAQKAAAPKRPVQSRRPAAVRKRKRKKTTLFGAILAEAEDRLEGLTHRLPFTADQFIRGSICALLIIFFAMLQTTVFSRFKPFGAIPDLMFALTVAIAFSEGEKWGGVCGLISAVVINSLGGYGITLLPLVYVAAGILCGYLVRDFFSNTALPRIAVITLFTIGRSVVSLINASFVIEITFSSDFVRVITEIIIPEYFSTVLMSAPVYLVVWLCFVRFHKTRAEKTGA